MNNRDFKVVIFYDVVILIIKYCLKCDWVNWIYELIHYLWEYTVIG